MTSLTQKDTPKPEQQQQSPPPPPPPPPSAPPAPPAPPPDHSEYEIIAQSACTSMAINLGNGGWTFAVQRQCDSVTITCTDLCSLQALHALDGQTKSKRWSCLGALHVYKSRPTSGPSTSSSPSMGFKVYWSRGYEGGKNCGPNFCCCHAAA